MFVNDYFIIILISIFFYIYFLYLLIKYKKRNKKTKALKLVLLSLIALTFSELISIFFILNNFLTVIFYRLFHIFSLLFSISILNLALNLTGIKIKYKNKLKYIFLAFYFVLIVLTLFSKDIIFGIDQFQNGLKINYIVGEFFILLIFFNCIPIFLSLFLIIQKYTRLKKIQTKLKYFNLFISIFLVLVFSFCLDYILFYQNISFPYLKNLTLLFASFLVIYSIYEWKAFDIKMKRFPIKTKLILPIICLIIFISVLFLLIIFKISSKKINLELFHRLKSAVELRKENINSFITDSKRLANNLSQNPEIRNYFHSQQTDPSQIQESLEETIKINNDIAQITLIDQKGNVLINQGITKIDQNRIDINQYLNNNQQYSIRTFFERNQKNEPYLIIESPVIDKDNFLGLIKITLHTNKLLNIIQSKIGLDNTGEIYIFNLDGLILTSIDKNLLTNSDIAYIEKNHDFKQCSIINYPNNNADNLNSTEFELIERINFKNQKTLAYNDFLKGINWCINAEVSEDEALETSKRILYAFGLIEIFIVITVYFVMSKIITRITDPIKKLEKGIEQIEKGNLDYQIGIKKNDEIGKLAQAFDDLTLAVKKSRKEIDNKVKAQTKEIIKQKEKLEDQQKALLNILEDVEEEKEKSSREKEKISAILQGIGDGVFVINKDYEIILFNKMAEKISGFTKKQVLDQPYFKYLKFVSENQKESRDQFVKRTYEKGEVEKAKDNTMLISKSNHLIPVSANAAPLKDKNGKSIGCVIVFRDITKEWEIDKAKTEFVSLASHQLRTPLSVINWYSEMLLNDGDQMTKKEKREYLKEIFNSNKRMNDLVNSLLNVSRIELGKLDVNPAPHDLKKIINQILKEFKIKINKKDLEVKTKFSRSLPKVKIDLKLINIVFHNLISNAIKYTPEKGTIKIELKKNKNNILFKVQDNGCGIPKKQHDSIFKKLFRADNVREMETDGNGLGLYIVKSIVDQTGGKIWFKSKKDQGSTFYVSIPLEGMKKSKGTKTLIEPN